MISSYLDFIISLIALACLFGGALGGGFVRMRLPEDHLPADSRDVVKLGEVWLRQWQRWLWDCWSVHQRIRSTRSTTV